MSESDEPKKKRPKTLQTEKGDGNCDQEAKDNLLQVLEKLLKILRTLLTEAQENASQSIEEFVADKVRRMGAMIGHYFTAFTALNVMSRNGLEEMIKQMYKHESIRDLEEEIYEIEDEWDSFLKDVDAKMNSSTEALKEAELIVGSRGPCELPLRDVLTGRHCSLQDLLTSSSTVLILLRHFA